MKKIILFLVLLCSVLAFSQSSSRKVKCKSCGTTHILQEGTGPAMFPTVSPNPVGDFIVISTEVETECEGLIVPQMIAYEIVDQNNITLLSAQFAPTQSHTIDVSTLQSGNYFIRIELDTVIDNSNYYTEQFIKQ